MCNLFLKPLSIRRETATLRESFQQTRRLPLPYKERGFDSYSPVLVGKGLGVRFKRKLHTALPTGSNRQAFIIVTSA